MTNQLAAEITCSRCRAVAVYPAAGRELARWFLAADGATVCPGCATAQDRAACGPSHLVGLAIVVEVARNQIAAYEAEALAADSLSEDVAARAGDAALILLELVATAAVAGSPWPVVFDLAHAAVGYAYLAGAGANVEAVEKIVAVYDEAREGGKT